MSRLASIIFCVCLAAASLPAQAQTAPTWPRTYQQGGAKLVVYQPQVNSWQNHAVLNGMAAVQLTTSPTATPVYGVVTFTAYTAADFTSGLVQIVDPRVTGSKWPGESADRAAALDSALRSTAQLQGSTVPLASILASMDASEALPKTSANLGKAPPKIFYSDSAAILVVFDRDPIMAPISGTGLTYAVNTNWNVIKDGSTYYLLATDHWLAAADIHGPWKPVKAPASFSALPSDQNWSDARAHLDASVLSVAAMPKVFVSTSPADMVLVSGSPKFAAISGTHLQYVTNTANDLFLYGPTKTWYVLLSGRWYAAASLNGPWTFATQSLPADFANIPINGPKGGVLVSVPNTKAAQYAGASAAIPQIATVDPSNVQFSADYSGDPQFKPIEGTPLQYAVNSPNDIIKVSDSSYYACQAGIWFTATAANGPWSVATWVPTVIYTIPPSSPLYHDTFVYVYSETGQQLTTPAPASTTTTNVYVGYTGGYVGTYWWYGAMWYGTGYYWPGYYYPGVVPIYYPYAATWYGGYGGWYGGYGYGSYTTANGAYGHYASAYGPYGGYTAAAQYNPKTGTYARGASAYGPNGSAAGASFYNPRYGVGGATRQYSTPYGSWGGSAVHTQNGNAYAAHGTNANGSAAGVSTRNGNTAVGKSNSTGDVYAGHDGNVYRNTGSGWQTYNNGSWNDVNKSTAQQNHPNAASASSNAHPSGSAAGSNFHMPSQPTMDNLNRDQFARSSGSSGFRGFSGGGGSSFRGGGGRPGRP
jgi:hypothetical protein